MNESNEVEAGKARVRRVTTVAAAALLMVCGVFGCVFYLEHQAVTGNYPQTPEQSNLQFTEEEKTAFLTKAKLLREKWRPWAEKHKDVLKRMLHAQPNEQTALRAAYAVIPSVPNSATAGIGARDLIPSNDLRALTMSKTPMFAWQPGDKTSQPSPDPALRPRYDQQKQFIAKRLQQHFTDLRDIECAISMNLGPWSVSLWASGRITQSTRVNKSMTVPIHGKPT